jgi:Predicted pPIWI-associating nuclease
MRKVLPIVTKQAHTLRTLAARRAELTAVIQDGDLATAASGSGSGDGDLARGTPRASAVRNVVESVGGANHAATAIQQAATRLMQPQASLMAALVRAQLGPFLTDKALMPSATGLSGELHASVAEMIRKATASFDWESVAGSSGVNAAMVEIANSASTRALMDGVLRSHVAAQTNIFNLSSGEFAKSFAASERLLADWMPNLATSGLGDAVRRVSVMQTEIESLARSVASSEVLRGLTVRPATVLHRYLGALPELPTRQWRQTAQLAGDGLSGLLAVEGLTADFPDLERSGFATVVEAEVVEAWRSGPDEMRAELFVVLDRLRPGLTDFIKGGWDDVMRRGPAAASKVAHCSVEVVDHALRAAAPDADVESWIATVPSRNDFYSDSNNLTRSARVRFVMRQRSTQDCKLAVTQVEALVATVQASAKRLQGLKHRGPQQAVLAARSSLMVSENVLGLLFLGF